MNINELVALYCSDRDFLKINRINRSTFIEQDQNKSFKNSNNYFTCYISRLRADENYPLHTHSYYELIIVLSGNARYESSVSAENITRGSVLFSPFARKHRICAYRGQLSFLNFSFLPQIVNNLFNIHQGANLLSSSRLLRFFHAGGEGRNIILSIPGHEQFLFFSSFLSVVHLYNDSIPQPEKAVKLFLIYLDLLLEKCMPETEAYPGITDSRISRVIEYIENNYLGQIQLAKIAADCDIPVPTLEKLFKQYVHTTITAYITARRITYACNQLADNSLPITQIAYHSGFNSLYHFNHVFKRLMKSTPTQYRAVHTKKHK